MIANERPEKHLNDILQYTRGIIFIGTPHSGSGLAHYAQLFSKHLGLIFPSNTDILDVLKTESEVLARIQSSFHTMIRARDQQALPPIRITCFFEELEVYPVGLVSKPDNIYAICANIPS